MPLPAFVGLRIAEFAYFTAKQVAIYTLPLPLRLKIVDWTVLLGGRPLSLPFRRRPLFLCGEAPLVRAPGGFGRPAASSFGSKTLGHEVGEPGQGGLAIQQLRAPLGGCHGDDPVDETSSETREQHQPLAIRKRRRVADVPR